MAEKAKKPQVILKRQVVTKAVVTENFKQFLTYELQENLKFYQNRVKEIKARFGDSITDPAVLKELKEAERYIASESEQKTFIEDLKLNTLYSQGPVDGFVTVSVGDNLYEKLGGVELIVEDGIVKKISSTPSQYQSVTT